MDEYHPSPDHVPVESAFDPANIASAQLIVSTRIYDVLMVMLKCMDADIADGLEKMHSEGFLLSPPPSFREE